MGRVVFRSGAVAAFGMLANILRAGGHKTRTTREDEHHDDHEDHRDYRAALNSCPLPSTTPSSFIVLRRRP